MAGSDAHDGLLADNGVWAERKISNSRRAAYARCPRLFWYQYERHWRPAVESRAIRMGSFYHLGLEMLDKGRDIRDVLEILRQEYLATYAHASSVSPQDDVNGESLTYECETVAQMVRGYHDCWGRLNILESEREFDFPLPGERKGKSGWRFVGRIDAMAKLPDGRTVVVERKLQSESLDSSSDLWIKARMDQQLTAYILAARMLGYEDVHSVLFDIARKPTIKPSQVPLLDNNGLKIVVDQGGNRVKLANGKWRQSGDESMGYKMLTTWMSPREWGEKLANDIQEHPHEYFARVECPRLQTDLDNCIHELRYYVNAMEESRRWDIWPRNVTRECKYCAMFGPCSVNARELPDGFVVDAIHR